jgi:hypothetical protein
MRADTMNLMRQAAQAHAMSRHRRGGQPKLRPLLPGQVWIKNASGADRDRFNVLGLSNGVGNVSFDPTASQLDQFQAWPVLSGGEPSDFLPFAVLLEPVPDGEIGRACISGVQCVKVNINEKGHRYAVPSVTNGSGGTSSGDYAYLRSADCGAQIVWRPDATGIQWCYVAVGAYTDDFFAKITSVNDWGSTGSHRKSYGFEEVYKTGSAYGNWSSLSGGWSGTAYNLIEELDREATKITIGSTTVTLDLRPRVGECVKMRARWYDGSLEYWFEYPIGHAAASGS